VIPHAYENVPLPENQPPRPVPSKRTSQLMNPPSPDDPAAVESEPVEDEDADDSEGYETVEPPQRTAEPADETPPTVAIPPPIAPYVGPPVVAKAPPAVSPAPVTPKVPVTPKAPTSSASEPARRASEKVLKAMGAAAGGASIPLVSAVRASHAVLLQPLLR
jgi:hypothetical protein